VTSRGNFAPADPLAGVVQLDSCSTAPSGRVRRALTPGKFASNAAVRLGAVVELIALRRQVSVLRRQRPGRLRLFSTDLLLWVWLYRVWLYRVWPQVLSAMVLVKPATVIRWHRKGFQLYWRWRSRRLGRSKMNTEIRLIRRIRSDVSLTSAIASSLCGIDTSCGWGGGMRRFVAAQYPTVVGERQGSYKMVTLISFHEKK
jgi:hypothetical protein